MAEELRNNLAVANNTTLAECVSQSDALFLIKRPSRRSSAGMVPSRISYATQLTRFEGDPVRKRMADRADQEAAR